MDSMEGGAMSDIKAQIAEIKTEKIQSKIIGIFKKNAVRIPECISCASKCIREINNLYKEYFLSIEAPNWYVEVERVTENDLKIPHKKLTPATISDRLDNTKKTIFKEKK